MTAQTRFAHCFTFAGILCLSCGSAASTSHESTEHGHALGFSRLVREGLAGLGGPVEVDEVRALDHQTTVPFTVIDNRVFVDVLLDGRGPYSFILDTGAHNVLDLATANELGLEPEEQLEKSGAGEAKVRAYRTSLDSLRVGEVVLTKPRVLVISLLEVRDAIGFDHLDGVLGLELFRSHVVTIDHGAGLIRFDRPEEYEYEGKGQVVPFEFSEHIPMVRGSVEGIPASFWVDLGDRSALTLNVPFAASSGLDSPPGPTLETITGWGVGGPIPAKVTRLESLTVGEIELGPVIARIPTLEGGAYMTETVSGSIGGAVLNRYDLVVDYTHQRLIFESGGAGPPPGYDRSGLWLNRGAVGFEIEQVVPESAADRLGLRVGEQIVAIDDAPATTLSLPELRVRLADPELRSLRLRVQQGDGAVRDKTLVLADLL